MRLPSALSAAAAAALACAIASAWEARPSAARHTSGRQEAVNPDARLQHEFTRRVEQYVALREKAQASLPELPKEAEPEQIAAHQEALLRAVGRLRQDARPGDLFRPETQALIRRMLEDAGKRPAGSQARSAIREEDPGRIQLRINGKYPDDLPLTTVPPQVLLSLPRLPDQHLEYRFVGDRLLLLDSRARMVVDYMDKALP